MTRLSDYTTEELERLTTLTLETALPGECVASRPPELQRLDSLYGRVDTTPVLLLQLRPATDAEVAAYHRAHCQPKPAPVVISNATHAGQWVQWNYGPCLVMAAGAQGDEKVEIVSLKGGRFYVRPDYLTLIDPPTWPQ